MSQLMKTRLISIVSKPSIVAAVVGVMVFVKKKLGPKTFDSKKTHVQKTLGLTVLDPKDFGYTKIRVK